MLRYLLAIIILFIIGFVVYYTPKIIIISNINCESQFGPCNRVVQDSLVDIETSNIIHLLYYSDKYFWKLDNTITQYKYNNLFNTTFNVTYHALKNNDKNI